MRRRATKRRSVLRKEETKNENRARRRRAEPKAWTIKYLTSASFRLGESE